MQQGMDSDLTQMIKKAKQDGVKLNLSSAYRSFNSQKVIFLNRLSFACLRFNQQNCNYSQFNTGKFDLAINHVLTSAAPPGMSKHHTGYAIDFRSGTGQAFKDSESFKWLSKNNYYNAKMFGFVPSYPENVSNIGPQPESWEYIWVGQGKLRYHF